MPLLKVIVASTRPGRVGRNIGDWFAQHAVEHGGFTVEIVDLAEVGLPFLDEPEHPATGIYRHQHSKDWSATIGEADAFAFVMPEYNYAFSAPQYMHKTSLFVHGLADTGWNGNKRCAIQEGLYLSQDPRVPTSGTRLGMITGQSYGRFARGFITGSRRPWRAAGVSGPGCGASARPRPPPPRPR
jgi:hypothetical protein